MENWTGVVEADLDQPTYNHSAEEMDVSVDCAENIKCEISVDYEIDYSDSEIIDQNANSEEDNDGKPKYNPEWEQIPEYTGKCLFIFQFLRLFSNFNHEHFICKDICLSILSSFTFLSMIRGQTPDYDPLFSF